MATTDTTQSNCAEASIEKKKIIEFIQQQHLARFRVIDNTGPDKRIIGGQFPDILFLQQEPPPNNNVLFVFKVETGTGVKLWDSVSDWKALSALPSVLYVVVLKEKLDEAKKLADVAGVKARFAWYEMDGDNVSKVHYE